MKKMLKSALAAAALAGMGAAQAAVMTFDGLEDSPNAPWMPLLTHGDEFYQSGLWLATFSNQAGAGAGDLVGAIVDGSDLANTCTSVACPTNNSTSFLTVLNDGLLDIGAQNDQSFMVKSLDVSFIGASGDTYPTIPGYVRIQGFKADNSGSITQTFALSGQTNGAFGFQTIATTGAFATTKFSEIYIFGFSCIGGPCTAFNTDKAQFAVDNLDLTVTAIPEPSTWLLMGLGLAAFGAFARRRNAA